MAVRDNTNRRLKEVLDIMAAGSWLDEKPNGGVVLAEAEARIPFTKGESELLSGGIPRGHKNLTKATAGLVKAGWMSKGRGGWAITENGLRATVAFDTVEKLTDALNNGILIPAGTALPEKPAAKMVPKQAASGLGLENQPASVALAGTFGEALGAKNWDPSYDAVQMNLDPRHGLWRLTAELPAGQYSYKAVVNGSWDENYGAFGINNGANHEFSHNGGTVTFRYDHTTKDVLRA